MPTKIKYQYWDSCVFLSYVNREPDRYAVISGLLEEVSESKGKLKIATSAWTIAEVAFYQDAVTGGVTPIGPQLDALWKSSEIEVLEVTQRLLRDAREITYESVFKGTKSIKSADAVHLATACFVHKYINNLESAYTYDKQLLNLSGQFGFVIQRPYTSRPRLIS